MKWLSLVLLFVRELIVSALKVAWLVLQPRLKIRPAIIAYPLTLTTDAQITLLANMITLTPGTLSVDVSEDRKTLYVHAIDLDSKEALIGSIAAGFERKILEVL
jgi:multicomponent Na+:H+ antiporter subunit E